MLKVACIPAYNVGNMISDVVIRSKQFVDMVIVCDDGSDEGADCCESGAYDIEVCLEDCAGDILGGAVLDDSGECCESGLIDGCGVCDGTGSLDEAGDCCQSGYFDECGVCGGDGSSCADVYGCTISVACNYDPLATVYDGSCDFFSCLVFGCDVPEACNYDPEVTINDGSPGER